MIKKYLSLVTFSHTIFALPFALVGFFIGAMHTSEDLSFRLLSLVVLCMVFARSAAMAFNRYQDRDIDASNERTQTREIPAGVISPNQALSFVVACCVLFICTTYFINPLCFYLSPVALFVVLGYTFTKRFTSLCHLVLGLGLALAPVGAYMAVTGSIHPSVICYGVAVFTWVAGFDIIYALQDESFDKSKGLHSIPVRFGSVNALNLSIGLHAITALALLAGSWLLYHGELWSRPLHIIALAVFIVSLVYQHRIVSANDLSRVNRAFFTTNGSASLVFGVLVIIDIVLSNML